MDSSEKAAFLPHMNSVAVRGLGRFGRSVALSLAATGCSVLGIDHDPEVVHALLGRIDELAMADTTDLEALRRLGIGEAGRAVVAIGQDIAASALTTSLLAGLEVRLSQPRPSFIAGCLCRTPSRCGPGRQRGDAAARRREEKPGSEPVPGRHRV
ncbi:NAD-binding protein [Nonomuraea fuscirosea]|uniref:NAD-binding protein n=1 Tax=Nonomuraea fuscirosea TaxID=1291556 RepID=UPI003445FB7B